MRRRCGCENPLGGTDTEKLVCSPEALLGPRGPGLWPSFKALLFPSPILIFLLVPRHVSHQSYTLEREICLPGTLKLSGPPGSRACGPLERAPRQHCLKELGGQGQGQKEALAPTLLCSARDECNGRKVSITTCQRAGTLSWPSPIRAQVRRQGPRGQGA